MNGRDFARNGTTMSLIQPDLSATNASPAYRPEPFDFAARWQEFSHYNNRERESDEGEIAFWHRNAEGYERGVGADPDSYRETLAVIAGYVRPTDTVLEIGAGTGRYTLPLAGLCRGVTAIDLSPDMLTILEKKAAAERRSNITTVRANWEDTPVERHDVVLAAWSMYRLHDVRAGLRKLLDATARTLIIVDGDFDVRPPTDPPHELIREEIQGPGDPGICNYLYFAGMLRQLGARADIRVVTEISTHRGDSPEAIIATYGTDLKSPLERDLFAARLRPHLKATNNGWEYTARFAVGLVVWNRPE